MSAQTRYWDSNVFLSVLRGETDKVSLCQGVIDKAQKGNVLIVTSAIALTEVIKLKNKPPLCQEDEDKINKFFMQDFIEVRPLDRRVAELARRLIWKYPHLQPKDSIHVATAIAGKVPILDTFDHDLLRLDGQVGDPPLRIGNPNLAYQLGLGV